LERSIRTGPSSGGRRTLSVRRFELTKSGSSVAKPNPRSRRSRLRPRISTLSSTSCFFCNRSRRPLKGPWSQRKAQWDAVYQSTSMEDFVRLLGNSLYLMQHDDPENRHALVEHAIFYLCVGDLHEDRQISPSHHVDRKIFARHHLIQAVIGIVDALAVQFIVEIPFQVLDVSGNQRFVVAVRHDHSGMELLEMFRQAVGRQIFQHLGVELEHVSSRRGAWMSLKSGFRARTACVCLINRS
jgi:hypothetical protein